MMYLRAIKVALSVAVFGALLAFQPAMASTINFDNVALNAAANTDATATAAGITFDNAVFSPRLDAYGIAIPGTEYWHVDTSITSPVTVANGSVLGGQYASSNGLDATGGSVLLQFNAPTDIGSFSITASSYDGTTFGGLTTLDLLFLDAVGNILSSVPYSSASSVFTASATGLAGVKSVVLYGGALYDNINIAAVPVPAALPLLLSGLGMLGFSARRKSC